MRIDIITTDKQIAEVHEQAILGEPVAAQAENSWSSAVQTYDESPTLTWTEPGTRISTLL